MPRRATYKCPKCDSREIVPIIYGMPGMELQEEEMRKKGAAFFYGQQSKFKRIFDLLNASKKTKH